jgi:hypothetical protein
MELSEQILAAIHRRPPYRKCQIFQRISPVARKYKVAGRVLICLANKYEVFCRRAL